METVRAVNEQFAFAYEWLNERGYRADVTATRRIHPAAMDFRTWLERTGAVAVSHGHPWTNDTIAATREMSVSSCDGFGRIALTSSALDAQRSQA